MNRAFLFDMDGVLVDSERFWAPLEEPFLRSLFGDAIAEQIIPPVGLGLEGIWNKARSLGAHADKETYLRGYEDVAMKVYDRAPITDGVNELATTLLNLGFAMAIVTQSPQTWIDRVVPRLPFREKVSTVISLRDMGLRLKPEPDGFLEACKLLGTEPEHSIVLEDSNYGITSGKAAGCYVIGYRGNLVEGYVQTGADVYADTMEDVIKLVDEFTRR